MKSVTDAILRNDKLTTCFHSDMVTRPASSPPSPYIYTLKAFIGQISRIMLGFLCLVELVKYVVCRLSLALL